MTLEREREEKVALGSAPFVYGKTPLMKEDEAGMLWINREGERKSREFENGGFQFHESSVVIKFKFALQLAKLRARISS
ncbi:uncharacterized protein G2W53_021182 [Senna tora]|uniref:Uncharacterized protein n=1 Tax=Senna tora TaxID=362788 RepID=A0A834WJB8_9FABA|nr:uncharacterized protein G2W53_021182 [Senna tora]